MYSWLWNHLPGPWPVKVVALAALAGAVVTLCFYFVFPWASPLLPFNNVTIEEDSAPAVQVAEGEDSAAFLDAAS